MSSKPGGWSDTSTSLQGAGHHAAAPGHGRRKLDLRRAFGASQSDMRSHETHLSVQIRQAELAFRRGGLELTAAAAVDPRRADHRG